MTSPPERTTMNGKPVLFRPAKTVLNMHSKFQDKLLCDGPTFSMGDACAYSCSFCYVPDMMRKAAYVPKDQPHADIVVRRENALDILRNQLRGLKREVREQKLVIYSSPLVDVAANMDLVRETIYACIEVLNLTNWHIRLLSKSNLLPKVAEGLSKFYPPSFDWRSRLIFGVSTGTLDDAQAAAFEQGCPKVSKRLESLHWLQDNGFRTFGMICPSLPQQDYDQWALDMAQSIRADQCEHVWAEVMNPRGAAMPQTVKALHDAGYEWQAQQLDLVSKDKVAWENYARQTFLAHVPNYSNALGPGISRLRFLQYVTNSTRDWWSFHVQDGAVLL